MKAEQTKLYDPRRKCSRWLPSVVVASVFAVAPFGGSAIFAAAGSSAATPVSGDESSSSTKYIYLAAIVVAVGLFAVFLGRRVIAARDRREVSWLDAFAKSAVIVVGLIVSIVIVPAKALELGTVQNMSGAAQDIIAVGLWSGALVIALVALWWAHREHRI